MKTKFFLNLLLFLAVGAFAPGAILLNEVDYDDAGTDDLEFIELVNTGGSPVDLSAGGPGGDGYYLILVNGSTPGAGAPIYETIELTGTIPANGLYTIAANNNNRAADQGGTGKTDSFASIQNGAPDGVALIERVGTTDTLVDSISYEHASATNDYTSAATANGLTIAFAFGTNGFNATDSADATSLQRGLGSNNPNDQSQWHPAAVNETFGAPNTPLGNIGPSIVEFVPFPSLPRSTDAINVFALVTDPENDPLTVTVDMTLQGGGTNNATLLDDGNPPDETAGDNIYSGTVAAFGSGNDGKTLTFVIHANDGTAPVVDSAAQLITIADSPSPISIAAARALSVGSTAIVNAITNTGKGVFNNNTFYLQDATGGINTFDTNFDLVPNSLIPLGADVTVLGRRTHAFGDTQTFNDVQLGEVGNASGYDWLAVRVNSTGNPVPAPQVITTAQLESNILDYEGELVRVNNPSVTSGSWPNPGNSGQFEISDGSGDVTCYIDADAGLTQRTQTQFGFIIGIASSQQVGGPARDPRLLPRFDSDVEAASAVSSGCWELYQ
ncbi:MAG: hypothetical protein Kow0059_12140 [Candidatus Sumerlaeia bacterium]